MTPGASSTRRSTHTRRPDLDRRVLLTGRPDVSLDGRRTSRTIDPMRRLLLIDPGRMFGRAVRLYRHRALPELRRFVSLGLELACRGPSHHPSPLVDFSLDGHDRARPV
jgi:hypothetical protein